MEKRLPLALFLSLLVLFAWNVCQPRPPVQPGEPDPRGVAIQTPGEPGVPEDREPAVEIAADLADSEERTATLILGSEGEPGHYRLVVSNRGARVVELDIGAYVQQGGLSEAERRDPEHWTKLVVPVATLDGESGSLLLLTSGSSVDLAPGGLREVLWTMEVLRDDPGNPIGVEFRYGPGTGVVFTKRILAVPGTWQLALELGIENRSAGEGGRRDFVLVPAGCMTVELGDRFYLEPRAVAIGLSEDGEYDIEWEHARSARNESGSLDVSGKLTVVGTHNKYFALLLRGADPAGVRSLVSAGYRGVRDEEHLADHPDEPKEAWIHVAADAALALELPDPGGEELYRYTIYAGPKGERTFVGDHPAHGEILDEDLTGMPLMGGVIAKIGRFLLHVLDFFQGFTGNWGVAIILLTLCVRAALFPLNRRSQTSMARYQKKMKRVQPRIDEVKKRHEDNPQKLREEQARIMQEEGAFPPLGGCLPIFFQIPIFFGLFSALRTSFDLRQAPFALWIDDLSRPDRLFEIGLSLPILGEVRYLNLLPLLMIVLMIVQQMGMPKPADEQAARMQKMMMFMPFLFGLFLYTYASGLSLYVITSSSLGIIEQKVIKKIWPIDDSEPEKKKKTGCAPFSGMMEQLAEKQKEQMRRSQTQRAQGYNTRKSRKRKGRRRA